MTNLWGINLQPLTNEIAKLSLTQQQIISLLQEQNQLLQKILDKK
jgi:hypothetical protein